MPPSSTDAPPAKNFLQKNAALFAALIFALITGWSVLGPHALNPTDTSWMKSDQAEIYLGWAFFRQDPHWHFPLSFSQRLSYPVGAPAAYAGAMPIVAVPMKLLSPLLPPVFQYLGIYSLLCFLLQAFFSFKLLRRFTDDDLLALLGSCFFILAPPFVFRFVGHFDLIAHWIILASLWLYFAPGRGRTPFSRPLGYALIVAIAGGISPYLCLMCLLVTAADAARTLLSERPLRFAGIIKGALPWLIPPVVMIVAWALFGFLEIGKKGHDYAAAGYREYSMNLLAPLDPHIDNTTVHSLIFKNLHDRPGQVEGYNYLGAGVIFMILLLLLAGRGSLWKEFKRPDFIPLWLATLIGFLLALSATVALGGMVLLKIPLPQIIEKVFAAFRSSGRFFWPGYYIILLFCIQFLARKFPRRIALTALLALLALQIADTSSLRALVLSTHDPRDPASDIFKAPFWRHLTPRFDKIVVLPPWQSRPYHLYIPGGFGGATCDSFGLLASGQGMTTNTCYLGRSRSVDLIAQNETLPAQVRAGKLDPDTLYVLAPEYLAAFVYNKYTHINGRAVDGMLVFWTGDDLQTGDPKMTKLPPPVITPEQRLEALQAMLEQVLKNGVDLSEIASGFEFPITAIPYDIGAGFTVPGPPLASVGDSADIPIFTTSAFALAGGGRITLDISPWPAPGASQTFTVKIGNQSLGEHTIKQRTKITLIFSPVTTGQLLAPLHFEWKTAGTEKQLGAGPDTSRLRAVLVHSMKIESRHDDVLQQNTNPQ